MTHYRGVILDVDGTLVDSDDAQAKSWHEAFADYGLYVPYARLRSSIGMGGDKLLPRTTGLQSNSREGKKISAKREEIFTQRYLPKIQAFPGTRELLQRMRDSGLKLAAASSAKQSELNALLQLVGARYLIETETSASDAKHSKPNPDIVEAALDRLGLPANEVVMLGDTPYDIEAARKIGIDTIAFRSGGWDDHELAGAIAIYNDPADLLEHYDTSPLGNQAQ